MANNLSRYNKRRKRSSGSTLSKVNKLRWESNNCAKEILNKLILNVEKECMQNENAANAACEDEYNFAWGSLDEFVEINKESLELEYESQVHRLQGYRIVNIEYFLERTMSLQGNHSKICTIGKLTFSKERKIGLLSTFYYKLV